MANASSLLIDLSPLRISGPFRLLYVARLSSLLVYGILNVATSVQAFAISGSSVVVATLMAAGAVPMAISLLAGGVLADRLDRRRIILVTRTAYLGAVAILIANTLSGTPAIWPMVLASVIGGLTGGFSLPALAAVTPMLIGRELLPAAAALSSIAVQAGAILGPFVAGLLIEASGVLGAYLVVAFGTVLTPVLLAFLPSLPPQVRVTTPPLSALADGVRHLVGSRLLLAVLAVDSLAMLVAMPRALLPQFADEVLGQGAPVGGLLYMAPAAGALAAALLSGWTRSLARPGIVIAVAIAVWGAGVIGLSTARQLWVALAFLAIMGFADTVSEILRSALLQAHTPDAVRGRIFSFWTMQGIVTPAVGNLEISLSAGWIGLRPALRCGGIACMLLTGLFAARSEPLRDASLVPFADTETRSRKRTGATA